jgi:uncharacterized Zn finger protein
MEYFGQTSSYLTMVGYRSKHDKNQGKEWLIREVLESKLHSNDNEQRGQAFLEQVVDICH